MCDVRFVAVMLLWYFLPVASFGQTSYYNVTLSIAGDHLPPPPRIGYANIDWSNPNDVRGELCLMPGNDAPGIMKGERQFRHIRRFAAMSEEKVAFRGTNQRKGVLALRIPPIADFWDRATLPLVLQKNYLLFGRSNKTAPRWENREPIGEESITFTLDRIPDDRHMLAHSFDIVSDTSIYRLWPSFKKFKLSNYDSLTKEQVLALELKNPPDVGDGGYEPGVVLAVVPRARLGNLRGFLTAEGGGAAFEDPS